MNYVSMGTNSNKLIHTCWQLDNLMTNGYICSASRLGCGVVGTQDL